MDENWIRTVGDPVFSTADGSGAGTVETGTIVLTRDNSEYVVASR